MSKLFARCRSAIVASVVAAGAAACSGGGGTMEPEMLTPEQVAGNYRICELTFTPEGGLPEPADLLAALDTTATITRLEIGSGTLQSFSLLYLMRGGETTQLIRGSYALGPQHVELPVGTGAEARRLLLPDRLRLSFDAPARSLVVAPEQGPHEIAKADYEAATGRQLAPAIRDRFSGRLSARFVHVTTPCS
jgi:hypothetical protein